MKVEDWPIWRPKPYDKNPRKIGEKSISKVAESIRAFGFRQPIVCDKHDVIIVGHTRYLAAQRLGMANVPVLVAADLSPAAARAYRLADNRTGEESAWDDELLFAELAGLAEEGFNVELTGFDEIEISALGGTTEAEARETLAARFMVPPFSVLNAREGWWQDRKRAWLALGIESELGRGGNLLDMSASVATAFKGSPEERAEWNAKRRKKKADGDA